MSAALLSSCISAKSIVLEPGKGGIVAISPRNNEEARSRAAQIMLSVCQGRPYQIIREEEVVVGQVTTTKKTGDIVKKRKKEGIILSSQEVKTTRAKTQWRLTYRCD
jgi:hypothetical protein